MTTYYVAPSGGNDAATGLTTGTALATLVHALTDHAVAGDTVILLNGSHEAADGFSISIKPASAITIQAETAGSVTLTSANGFVGCTVFLSGQRLNFVGITVDAGAHATAVFINAANCSDVTFTNCTFVTTTASGHGFRVNARNTKRLTFTDCTFSASSTAIGFTGSGTEADHATDWTFTDCTFETAANACNISTYVDRVTFTTTELTTTAASSIALNFGTDYVTDVVLTNVTATGKAAAFKSVGKIAGITITGGTYVADEAGSFCINIGGVLTSGVSISGATITGELCGLIVTSGNEDDPVDGATITDCVIRCTNAADDTNCVALEIGDASDVVIDGCDCESYAYGALVQGRINNFSASNSRFAGEEAMGLDIACNATHYMSGNIQITKCVAEGLGTLGKGMCIGAGMNGANITVSQVVARNTGSGIGFRFLDNITTAAAPWIDTRCTVFDSFVSGTMVVGTGHDQVTVRDCAIQNISTGSAVIVRRGIAGAAVNFIGCTLINTPTAESNSLLDFRGTRHCTFTKCSLLAMGVAGRVIDVGVNAAGETVEGFSLQSCSIFVPYDGTLYNLVSANLSATPSIRINNSSIAKFDHDSSFGTVFDAPVATLAGLRTAWNANAGTIGNDGASAVAIRKGHFGFTKKIIRLL